MRAVFWVTIGLIFWTYAGFALLLLLRGLLFPRRVRKAAVTPRVSLVIVAHNEVATIGAKLKNVYSLDYPPDHLEVIVASDGSDDGTDTVVGSFDKPGLRLLSRPRAGKIPALNAAVSSATGDILVFSDANSMYGKDALRALVAPFADPTVGAVGGNQCYTKPGDEPARSHMASGGERLYWSYDRLLKRMQSRAGNMIGATGAIYAIRRELFRPAPLGVSDDFFISTGAIRLGYRLVFEERAVAYETLAPSDRAEFNRKLRVIVRALRAVGACRELLDPFRYGFYSLQLVSHKLLRWSVSWMLLILLISSLVLAPSGGIYAWAAAAQLLFYTSAVAVHFLRNTRVSHVPGFRLLGLPYYFCLANLAALRAWLQVGRGKRVDIWDSQRPAGAHA